MIRSVSSSSSRHHRRSALVALLASVLASVCVVLAVPVWASTGPAPQPKPNGLNDTTVGVRTSGPHSPDNRANFHYEIPPGAAVIDYVAISNYSFHPVTVRVLTADITSTATDTFVAAAGKPHDGGSWIIPEETLVHIPKTSMQIVPFQLTVPRNATPGDHPAAILVSLLVQQPNAKGREVVVDHRIGLRIYLRVPGQLMPQLAIKNLHSHFAGGYTAWGFGHMVTDFNVVNTGNVTVSATQALKYTRSLWLGEVPVKLGPLQQIVPGGSIHVHSQSGSMFAFANVDTYVSETPTGMPAGIAAAVATAKVGTFVFPWAWLVLLLVLIVLGYLARRWWKKHKAKKAAAAEARRVAEEPTGGKHRNGDPDPAAPASVDAPVDLEEDPS